MAGSTISRRFIFKAASVPDFVSAHQSRVPGDIGRQHRRQSLFHALPGHEAPVG